MKQTPDDSKTIASAWDVHKDADGVFYSQINGFLLANSFLVAGFVVLFVANDDPRTKLLGAALALLGLVVTSIWSLRLKKNVDRLWFLKHRYLVQMDAYQNYISASDERERQPLSERRREFESKREDLHPLADHLPFTLGAFWFFALILDLTFFLIPGRAAV